MLGPEATMWAVALASCSDPRPEPVVDGVDVVGVSAAGASGAYTLFVTLRADETGCDRYADWWEVLTPDGALVYRRILDHSHPDEQPFERSGGPVPIGSEEEVVVRGHLHPDGFGGVAVTGAVDGGWTAFTPEPGWAAAVDGEPPLPAGCLF